MKSAIFQDTGLTSHKSQPRKQPSKQWPRASSPFVVPHSATASPKWNLDDMLSNYTASGILPAPLSPTLPPQFTNREAQNFNQARVISDDDDDTDSLPLSLLSPTLPSIFEDKAKNPKAATLSHPLPKKPSTVHSMLHSDASITKTSSVRWLDRLDDPKKPRFLLRIHFSPSTPAYTKIQHLKRRAVSSKKPPSAEVKGLAISGLKQTHDPIRKSFKHPDYKEFLSQRIPSAKEDTILAITAQFDWILCSAIACDAERRSKLKSSVSVIDAWNSLLADIPSFVLRIESFIKSSNVSDRKKSFLSFLVGVLAVCKASILKRVNTILLITVEEIEREVPATTEKQKIIDLQQKQIRNFRKIEEYFAESQSFFKNSPPPSTICPKTWSSRASSIPKPSESLMSPSTDVFFLPLGSYSDLGEACAFLFGCLRDFIDIFGIGPTSEKRYHLSAGEK